MKPNPRSLTNRLIVPFATSTYLRGPSPDGPSFVPSNSVPAAVALRAMTSQAELSEQPAPGRQWLELTCGRLKREDARRDRRRERGIRGHHDARHAAGRDDACVVRGKRTHVGRLE